MTRRKTIALCVATALFIAAGGAAYAYAAQPDEAATLRSTGQVGEQADGYLGLVGAPDSGIRERVNDINIRRRAYYTDLARRRGATIEEVAAATACEIFASRVAPGQYYRLTDGQWRQRNGSEPVPRPSYCG